MNYFIFQGVDKSYPGFLNDLQPGNTVRWTATRYRSRMSVGDLVFLWRGGDTAIRGVYGWGRITGATHEIASSGGENRVPVKYERRLDQHISISAIRSDARLGNMQILNLPVGTNFQINLSEAQALVSHMPTDYRPKLGEF
jgi:hypothetical protein